MDAGHSFLDDREIERDPSYTPIEPGSAWPVVDEDRERGGGGTPLTNEATSSRPSMRSGAPIFFVAARWFGLGYGSPGRR